MTASEFAAAQQRIAARRGARESSNQACLLKQKSASQVSTQLSRLPSPLRQLGVTTQNIWSRISGRQGTRPSFRVGQFDAELLDEELLTLLKSQVGDGLKYFGSHLQDKWAPEITLVLRAILFKLTVWDHNSTYGAALQNLQFSDARNKGQGLIAPSRVQKLAYALFTVGGQYAWNRWEEWLLDRDGGYEAPNETVKRLSRVSDILTMVHSTAAFASFLIFLIDGRYRTLLNRVLRLRLVPATSQVSREVSFEYLNRQLVWHAFTEFLLFALPLVGISRWRRWLARLWRQTKFVVQSGRGGEENIKSGELSFLPERTCAICYQDQNPASTSEVEVIAASGASGIVGSAQTDITNPYESIPCGCIYCFVCLASQLGSEDHEGWNCLRCGGEVTECKPWSGDVLETHKSTAPMKTVLFSEPLQETSKRDLLPPEIIDGMSQRSSKDQNFSNSELYKPEYIDVSSGETGIDDGEEE